MADINITTRVTTNRMLDVAAHPAHPDQLSLPAAEAITAGSPVRIDLTTGRFTNANATSAAEALSPWIAGRTVGAGQTVTAFKRGILDGYDLSGLTYGQAVYLSNTDGRLADAAGTVSVVVGHVVPGTAERGAYAKLLRLGL